MKSIQTKIVVFILVIIMLCSGVVGSIAMIHLTKVSDQNSAQIMNLSCRDEGKKLDSIFYSVFNHALNLRNILIDSKWSLREGRKKEGQLLKKYP